MKRLALIGMVAALLLSTTAMAADKLMQRAQQTFNPLPSEPPAIPDNAYSKAKDELGKLLYFDPRLSRSWLISCNTCHNLALGGVDMMETSIGHGWQAGPRNAPTVLNSVFHVDQFWDGRADDLKEQAMGPMQASVEMNSEPKRVEQTLASIPEYVERFEKAFPDSDPAVTFENVAAAIEIYETTLITPNSPFDQYLEGDESALSQQAKQGLQVFMDSGCTSCHRGMNLGGDQYFKFGLVSNPGEEVRPTDDKGREQVTGKRADRYVFRVPTLRNVALTAPYFHSGKVWDLGKAVQIMAKAQLGRQLSDADATAVVAFLKSLTGDQPQVDYPVLPPHTAQTPKPVTQVQAGSADMGH